MDPQNTSEERQRGNGPGRAEGNRPAKGKVHRIGQETRGLFEDFAAWVELRLRLAQMDAQDYVRQKIDEAVLKAALVAAGLFSALFALVTLALFAGWLFGRPAWGFLTVTGLLLACTGLLYVRHRRKAAEGADRGQVFLFSGKASRNGDPENHASEEQASE